ncbi:Glycosyl hydrolases family 2, TIM barrel domain-containing protein [Bifidobacterium ramosum]|nr:glycoside hydrolase family 2 TIM barrel-domain containing protein [Bifidobacterium ramosum]KAB8287072.1 Glycosyl hydrolases family 2, TIM barrel domain-containing protein [Bifidobacterium ramosum]
MTHPRIIPLSQTETSRYHVRDAGGTATLNHGPEREVVDLADLGWRFACGHGDDDILDPATAAAPDFDDSGWEPVTLPHTWNALDTNDGVRGNMNRTVGWYRAHLHVPVSPGRRTYLEFDGVNSITSLYVDGRALAPLSADPRDTAWNTGDPAHLGGYAMFRYDLTDALLDAVSTTADHDAATGNDAAPADGTADGDVRDVDVVIAVRVDNRRDLRVAPLFADFNFYGGIYRPARLVRTADVHLALDDHGASGLRVVTPNAGRSESVERPDHLGLTRIEADIVNDADRERHVLVRTTIVAPSATAAGNASATTVTDGTALPIADDAHDVTVANDVTNVTLAPRERRHVKVTLEIKNPHLWQPIDYSRGATNDDVAYQYNVRMTVIDTESPAKFAVGNGKIAPLAALGRNDNTAEAPGRHDGNGDARSQPATAPTGTPLDSVAERIGYRWFHVSHDHGFFINGRSHPLRGVTRHQDREGLGNALHDAQHLEDFTIIMQMGVNYLRLAHYPHANYFYDLCDANGVIVWAEIPFIDWVGEDERFADVTKEQLVELIRQQGNRPSICFWGLQNEVGNHNTANQWIAMPQLSRELNDLAHTEDATRYTTQAADQDETASSRGNWASDIISWNMYPGWYSQPGFGALIEQKRSIESRPLGLSEYGTGASIDQHELHPNAHKTRPNSYWQPEEYQSMQHEEALAYINAHDWLWSTSLWNMFDFGVDHRPSEAGRFEINNKGLVTWDRRVKKDAFYLHKANWNRLDPFVYIASRRYTAREEGPSTVRVYSNLDRVWLQVAHDGAAAVRYDARACGNGVFTVDGLLNESGVYTIWAYGVADDGGCEGEDGAVSPDDGAAYVNVYADQVIWTRLADGDRTTGGRIVGAVDDSDAADDGSDDGRARIADGAQIPWSLWARPDSGFSLDREGLRMIAQRPLPEITPEQWQAAFSFNGSGTIDFYATLPTGLTPADKAVVTAPDGTQTVFTVVQG